MKRFLFVMILAVILSSCSTSPPLESTEVTTVEKVIRSDILDFDSFYLTICSSPSKYSDSANDPKIFIIESANRDIEIKDCIDRHNGLVNAILEKKKMLDY